MAIIPKIVLQVSKDPQPAAVVKMLMKHFVGYDYLNFTDKDCIHYMMTRNENSNFFPQIVERFNSFEGAHKADLFRYFFLYQEGGIFVDSDLMLYVPIHQVLGPQEGGVDFVSIRCYPRNEDWIFNGFMAVTKRNPIMWNALNNAYHCPAKYLKADYFYFVRVLYNIVMAEWNSQKIILYQEVMTPCGYAFTPLQSDVVAFRHFFHSKRIPIKEQHRMWKSCENII